MKISKILIVGAAIIGLIGCEGKPPNCADATSIDLIKQIFFDSVKKSVASLGGNQADSMSLMKIQNNVGFSVSNIRSEGYDENAKKYSCASDIVLDIKQTPQSDLAIKNLKAAQNASLNPNTDDLIGWQLGMALLAKQLGLGTIPDLSGVEIDSNKINGSIKYTSTFAEDPQEGKRQYVEVFGIMPFVNSVVALSTAGGFNQDTTKSETNPQPESVSHTQDSPPPTIIQGLNFTERSKINQPLKTNFGDISINGENILLFNGQPLSPTIQGNNSLSLVDYSKGEASDTLLVQDNGGTGCPALYYFILISASGAKPSEEFGTCSDSLKTARKGKDIIVSMPGFMGPFEPAEAQEKAANELHVFSLSGGRVFDNGKPETH